MTELTWKDREPAIAALSRPLLANEIVHAGEPPVVVRLFFCQGVMEVVRYIRHETKALETGAQHHVFKILGKYATYGENGRLEAGQDLERMDIYFDETMVAIQVKTLVKATFDRIHKKTVAVFNAPPVDHVWVFFLYKFKDWATPKPPCQYLLCWVEIDPLNDDPDWLVDTVMTTIESAKKQAAKELRVPKKIFIPVENILKVEDLEREIEEKNKIIAEQSQALAEKDEALAEKDRVINDFKKRFGIED